MMRSLLKFYFWALTQGAEEAAEEGDEEDEEEQDDEKSDSMTIQSKAYSVPPIDDFIEQYLWFKATKYNTCYIRCVFSSVSYLQKTESLDLLDDIFHVLNDSDTTNTKYRWTLDDSLSDRRFVPAMFILFPQKAGQSEVEYLNEWTAEYEHLRKKSLFVAVVVIDRLDEEQVKFVLALHGQYSNLNRASIQRLTAKYGELDLTLEHHLTDTSKFTTRDPPQRQAEHAFFSQFPVTGTKSQRENLSPEFVSFFSPDVEEGFEAVNNNLYVQRLRETIDKYVAPPLVVILFAEVAREFLHATFEFTGRSLVFVDVRSAREADLHVYNQQEDVSHCWAMDAEMFKAGPTSLHKALIGDQKRRLSVVVVDAHPRPRGFDKPWQDLAKDIQFEFRALLKKSHTLTCTTVKEADDVRRTSLEWITQRCHYERVKVRDMDTGELNDRQNFLFFDSLEKFQTRQNKKKTEGFDFLVHIPTADVGKQHALFGAFRFLQEKIQEKKNKPVFTLDHDRLLVKSPLPVLDYKQIAKNTPIALFHDKKMEFRCILTEMGFGDGDSEKFVLWKYISNNTEWIEMNEPTSALEEQSQTRQWIVPYNLENWLWRKIRDLISTCQQSDRVSQRVMIDVLIVMHDQQLGQYPSSSGQVARFVSESRKKKQGLVMKVHLMYQRPVLWPNRALPTEEKKTPMDACAYLGCRADQANLENVRQMATQIKEDLAFANKAKQKELREAEAAQRREVSKAKSDNNLKLFG
jgi:hypothetical protein